MEGGSAGAAGEPLVGDRLAAALETAAREFWLEVSSVVWHLMPMADALQASGVLLHVSSTSAIVWIRNGYATTHAPILASPSEHGHRSLPAAAR